MAHIRATANRYNFAIAFFVSLGSFTYGYNSAIIASVIGQPSFSSYFDFDTTTSYGGSIIGACNGLYAAAGCIGCWTIFSFMDLLGRKRSIQVIALVCIISAAIQAGSVHIAMFLIGRFLNGLAVGWMNCTIPTYMSEISPPKQRGRVVGSHGFIICCAYGAAGWSGFGTYYESNPTIQWRLLCALQIVAPLILLLGSPWIPESPRWLINKGFEDKGLRVLESLHAQANDSLHIGARQEFEQIKAQLAIDRTQKPLNMIQLVFHPKYRKRMFYGFYIQALGQSTGVLVIANYMVLVLNNLGLSGSLPLLLLAVYNSWAALLNFTNALVIDRLGRIRNFLIGCSGCLFCLIIVTALQAHYGYPDNPNKLGQGFTVFFTFLFVTFYGFGADVSAYVYCTEIFPTHIRSKGVGWSVSGLFVMATIYTTAAGPAFNSIGWKYYLVFIIVTALMIPYMVLYFPETKGLSLEEIGALFGDEVAVDVPSLSDESGQGELENMAQADADIEAGKGMKHVENVIGIGETKLESHREKLDDMKHE